MNAARALAFSVMLISTSAYAARDLAVSIVPPAGAAPYATARYVVNVKNVGNQSSQGGSLRIDLPKTNTSPTVYVLGTVSGFTSTCSRSGARITCPVGTTGAGVTRQFYVDIAVPESAAPVAFRAEIIPTVADNVANNVATTTHPFVYAARAITTTVNATNSHCTGTGLTSYFECTLFPSSVMSHPTTLEQGGNIGFPTAPGYAGSWWQTTPDQLSFEYTDGIDVVAEFTGHYTGSDCFEGVTTFPGSTYVSPYRVCITP